MTAPTPNPEPTAPQPAPKRDKREYSRDWHRAHATELYERRKQNKQLYYLAVRKAAKGGASWEAEAARFLRIGLVGHAR